MDTGNEMATHFNKKDRERQNTGNQKSAPERICLGPLCVRAVCCLGAWLGLVACGGRNTGKDLRGRGDRP